MKNITPYFPLVQHAMQRHRELLCEQKNCHFIVCYEMYARCDALYTHIYVYYTTHKIKMCCCDVDGLQGAHGILSAYDKGYSMSNYLRNI